MQLHVPVRVEYTPVYMLIRLSCKIVHRSMFGKIVLFFNYLKRIRIQGCRRCEKIAVLTTIQSCW